ncbi:hypothetical protein LTR70_003185 [Exophiala xenobiotica]|uniref:Uncharacterized protein n=1 Tax=Lithohypha guttulata TaxID=1690604 RepID=A0ABR0KGL2_9EURO|nr:hypothetical protein LTR24_002830 [Lithohypha guttulata]KAK5323697.1 hypothetical protein LTR70_003185 [Exophiala xenobiotica]
MPVDSALGHESTSRHRPSEEEVGTQISRDGLQSTSAGSVFDGRAENFESPPSSHGDQSLPANSNHPLAETKTSPAHIPLPFSPALSFVEGQAVSTHDFGAAEAHSLAVPARPKEYDTLREGLRRLAELRMGALEVRAMKKEERTNIRNLHRQLTEEVRKLIYSMREKLPSATVDDLTNWEDSFILIEDVAEESEQADVKIAQAEGRVIQVEWDMCGLEEELYEITESGGPGIERPSSIRQGSGYPRLPAAGAVTDAVAPSSPVSSGDTGSLVSPTGPEAEARYYRHAMLPSGPSLGSEEAEESFHLRPLAEEEALMAEEDISLAPPLHESAELNICNGWQFVDIDTAAIREEASRTGLLAGDSNGSEFTQVDLYGLSRWLMYGTPWNIHLMSNQDRLRAVISSFQIFRAWLTNNLEALSAPHVHSAKVDERNYSMLTRYVRNWQWDPSAKADAGPEDAVGLDYDTLRGDAETEDQASPTQWAPSAPFFEPLGLHTPRTMALAPNAQQDAPPPNRRIFAAHAPSEVSPQDSRRHDLHALQERRARSQSLP